MGVKGNDVMFFFFMGSGPVGGYCILVPPSCLAKSLTWYS